MAKEYTFDYKAWSARLDQLIGTRVDMMSPTEFKAYVCCFPLKTAREYFDWTGSTPIVDHFCLVVGKVPDGMAVPEHFEFINELNVYYAPREGKKFVNQYARYKGDDDEKEDKSGQTTLT